MTREELLQVAKPILFNTDMVRAILDDRKTATRRIMKPQPILQNGLWMIGFAGWSDGVSSIPIMPGHSLYKRMPYKPGDYLYVRETWMMKTAKRYDAVVRIGYRAGGQNTIIHFPNGCTDSINRVEYDAFTNRRILDRWYPSIHMPKAAARIFLRVKDVRVERLQDMWASDVSKEGIYFTKPHTADEMIAEFEKLWNTTIPKKDIGKYGWTANPWVWVIEFERIHPD